MAHKDYYAVLGLLSGACDSEIRKAYRRLARRYHPDLNPNNRWAEERFKEINEAYTMLRAARKQARGYQQEQPHNYQQESTANDFDWSRWFS